MKKRILCSILAAILLLGTFPLSVFATEEGSPAGASAPSVSVSSLYHYQDPDDPLDYRALPDDSGTFYFDISLDQAPAVDEDILVYYRTVDDSAVSNWGDYDAVGTNCDAYVTLNKANGYKARVSVRSAIVEDGFRGPTSHRFSLGIDESSVPDDRILSRRFYFQLIEVRGSAVLAKPASDAERDQSTLACHLKADRYHYQHQVGVPAIYTVMPDAVLINTPEIDGVYSDELNIRFDEHWRNYVASGDYSLGLGMYGDCYEDFWNCDGPANLDIYYMHEGERKIAFTLYMEGEWDDSTFYGWELAYDYLNKNFYGGSRDIDVEDYWKDNFRGFQLYDNDENVIFSVGMKGSDELKAALREGYAVETEGSVQYRGRYDVKKLHYLKLPSNFVFADSYSFRFTSKSDSDPRWLEDVSLSFCLIGNEQPRIEETPSGVQMVSTNINQLVDGDLLRLSVRFDRPVYLYSLAPDRNDCYIEADINGSHSVKLTCVPTYACDTLVFEGELPESAKNIKITSLRNLRVVEGPYSQIRSYITGLELMSRRIDDLYGYDCDLRVPVTTVSGAESDIWVKSKPLDLYLSAEGTSARFSDYARVYYQWSNSPALPKSFDSSLTFYTAEDGEVVKSIVGTGNGEMYLHIKTVSRYGRTSYSDRLTESYDPEDPSAVYTPYGPYKFDNLPPALSAEDVSVSGSLKEQMLSIRLPDDSGGVGLQSMSLYFIAPDAEGGEGTLLKKFVPEDFSGDPKTLHYTITHVDVGVGVDANGVTVSAREEVDFYWILSDRLGNVSDATARFTLIFDTNDYLDSEILAAGPYNPSEGSGDVHFEETVETVDSNTYIYDYLLNEGRNEVIHSPSGRAVHFGFFFKIDHAKFGETDNGSYSATVSCRGETLTNVTLEYIEEEALYALWLHDPARSGRYEIRLFRTEGDSTRVSSVYSVYATGGEDDATAVRERIASGTLLNNEIYQLSAEYPYFYYKDSEGVRQTEYYNDTKQPASFSSYSKAKEYVYFKELSDLSLIRLNAATATALNSGTSVYLMAKGETTVAQEGQYWIRYKSDAWTPGSTDSSWVYYYYGSSEELTQGALSLNLQNALNTVANRIVGYGKSVILTDTSLFLGSVMGDKMLDEYGMPYLLEGQIHDTDEIASHTKCGNEWSVQVSYSADRSIYKSSVHVGKEGDEDYQEYPIIGNFTLPEDSRFQYVTYEEYSLDAAWKELPLKDGQTLVDVFAASGIYYLREMAREGVGVYAIYVDKEAPKVSFSKTDEEGNLEQIPVDGVEILDIRAKEVIIGSIAASEYDRQSYVAVYKVSNLSLVAIYTAGMLDDEPVKLEDGNYYIVVADRSGNHYTITVKVSSADLDCQIKESPDRFIRLTCNRRGDQIQRYEVYLNGELVTSTYATEQTFDGAGLYSIYVQDIYGNVYSEEYLFQRNYPTVTWKYLGTDGKYHTYDSNSSAADGFVMTWMSANKYKISTAVKTRFSFSENYGYTFVGTAPKYHETTGAETVVTIDEGQSFTLKVYYKNYPDNYTIYSGVVDILPPSVSVFAEIDIPVNGENALVEQWIAEGEVGDVLQLRELFYSVTEKGRRTIMNGGTVSSDLIRINAADANELSLVQVYLDGNLIKEQNPETGFSQLVVSRWGSYLILAKDSLGNITEFTFVNGMPEHFAYSVDGDSKEIDLHGHLYFETVDGKTVYTKVDYGNRVFALDIRQNADVFVSVGEKNGQEEIYGFRIADGCIFPLSYRIVLNESENKTVKLQAGEALLSLEDESVVADKEYRINVEGSNAVYASIAADGAVSIRVYAPEDRSKVLTVSARLEFGSNDTSFVSAELSKKCSVVSFQDPEGEPIAVAPSGTDVRVSGGFVIDETAFADERVKTVSLYYSTLNDLDPGALAGRSDIYVKDEQYTEEGFYLLIVKNLYGNDTVYRIGISKGFGISASVLFADGYQIYYSRDYDEILYSNHRITLDLLDEGIVYEVLRDGEVYQGFAVEENGEDRYLIFSQDGTYRVTLTDAYGNEVVKQLQINKAACSVNEDLLTGYNENALRRDEGYTNQRLSVDKAVYDREGLYYLAIQYGDHLQVLFDAFAEQPIQTPPSELDRVIGNRGDGLYTVICRNRYGAVLTKEIHYRGTPTLHLERTTRSQSAPEVYDLDAALLLGFWSNNTLSFRTDATSYVFTVNGDATECPRTLAFQSSGEFGSTEYEITYVDEYGFSYRFWAYLVRRSVEITLPEGMDGIEVDGILHTQSDISIFFDDTTYATYTRDHGEAVAYRSGDVLKKDGTYRFTVTDYAGNATTLTVKKDTVVEFSFVESGTMTAIQNGSVVNASKVSFDILNKDHAFIERVLKDGVVQKDYSGTSFTEDGKWELIISDRLGNKAYFCFYIVTHSMDGFAYTTPYEFRITELWYDAGDGVKISYMNFVNHGEYTSSFDFAENGHYSVVMTSAVTGSVSKFNFTVNTLAPDVSLVGCNPGETTINDVSLSGCKIGDRILVYRATGTGEELIQVVEVTSLSTQMPTISEGGEYRIVVESEAGVATELHFVRKHVMNTAGSVFIILTIAVAVIGLFTGLVYRNKSKTDD